MTTTTIRLDDDLRARIAAAAERAGKTAHAFMVEAIARTVDQDEEDDAFHRLADERWAAFVASGETVSFDDMNVWLEAHLRGEGPERPLQQKLKD